MQCKHSAAGGAGTHVTAASPGPRLAREAPVLQREACVLAAHTLRCVESLLAATTNLMLTLCLPSGGPLMPWYLSEKDGWTINIASLRESVDTPHSKGMAVSPPF